MRIDKYLWSIRVFKTRSLASEACKGNKVKRGGDVLKASKSIAVGDLLTVAKGNITLTIEIIALPKSRVGAKLVPDFAKNLTPPEEYDKAKREFNSFYYENKYKEGRPTKRDRRQIEQTFETNLSQNMESTDWDSFFNEEEEDEDL